jgi:hypothetical protein
MENLKPLIPNITSPSTTKKIPKDLTDTLLANNLNELNWSNKKMSLLGTVPNHVNVPKNNFPNSNASQILANQIPQLPYSLNWNQSLPEHYNTSLKAIKLTGSNTGWTSSAMVLSNTLTPNSSLQDQSTPKLSSEEIMDFLK